MLAATMLLGTYLLIGQTMTAQTAESNREDDGYRGTSPALRRHVDPDPPDIASLAVRVGPNGPKSLRLDVGHLVRLDPDAFAEGWRIAAETSTGVLWPVPEAPRVFRARCPGVATIHIDRVVEEIKSSTGPYIIPILEQRGLQVEVVTAHGAVPSFCGRSFDPPRKKIQGELRGGDFGRGILLSVGERFTLIAPGVCKAAWNDVRFAGDDVLKRLPDDPRGPTFQTVGRGVTELSVPIRTTCAPGGYRQHDGEREHVLLVVE